jgi:hypothetical protein
MEECAVCWSEITNGSESSLQLSKAARRMLKEELGYSDVGSDELLLCQDCIKDIIADYFI